MNDQPKTITDPQLLEISKPCSDLAGRLLALATVIAQAPVKDEQAAFRMAIREMAEQTAALTKRLR